VEIEVLYRKLKSWIGKPAGEGQERRDEIGAEEEKTK